LVEVESADPACSVDGPLLGPPRLPVRPRSQPAVCAVVENGVRTGAMIAGTDAKSIIRSHWLRTFWRWLLLVLFAACFRLLTAAQVSTRQVLPGALLAAGCWLPSGARGRRVRDRSARSE
jgi:hypothetical protein